MKTPDPYRNFAVDTIGDLGNGMELCTIKTKSEAKLTNTDANRLADEFSKSMPFGIWPKTMNSRSSAASIILKSKLSKISSTIHEEDKESIGWK